MAAQSNSGRIESDLAEVPEALDPALGTDAHQTEVSICSHADAIDAVCTRIDDFACAVDGVAQSREPVAVLGGCYLDEVSHAEEFAEG